MKKIILFLALVFVPGTMICQADARDPEDWKKFEVLERKVMAYEVSPVHKEDAYGLLVVKVPLPHSEKSQGGIGACLVDTAGKIVEQGRNRQYDGYFRSDLHAEMDLLNRYEERMKKINIPDSGKNVRDCHGLVLVTSVEPCPMCLVRIINSGIKTILYVTPDEKGGMASRIDCLPPFWRKFSSDREFRLADCSDELRKLALELFHFSHRSFAKNRDKKQ